MKYFKFNTEGIQDDSKVTLSLPGKETLTGYVACEGKFLVNSGAYNDEFITHFGINRSDKYKFVEDVVGYETSHTSDFPPVDNIDDLKKVLKALENYYDKEHGLSSTIYVTHKHNIKLRFKL